MKQKRIKLIFSKKLLVFVCLLLTSAGILVFFSAKNITLPFYMIGWLGLCTVANLTIIPICLALLNDKTGFVRSYKKAINIAKKVIIIYSVIVIPLSVVVFFAV